LQPGESRLPARDPRAQAICWPQLDPLGERDQPGALWGVGQLRTTRLDTTTYGISTSTRRRPIPTATSPETNRRRSRQEYDYELLDTGVFDQDRYFDVLAEYAKASPDRAARTDGQASDAHDQALSRS
jgi:hypothetical protein